MNVTVDEIREDERGALANLIKMYCYEWSQYNLFDVDQTGVYPFEQYVHTYFDLPDRRCYFVRADGVLAGFALIDRDFVIHTDYDYSMGEFFVMYKYRRLGIGRKLAFELFDRHRGKWEVGFHPLNVGSEKFWISAIAEYSHGDYTLDRECPALRYNDGSLGSVISFDSGKHVPNETVPH